MSNLECPPDTKFEEAKEFYDYLIGRQTKKPDETGRLLFRGHSTTKYELIPSGLREGGLEWLKSFEPVGKDHGLGALSQFYRRATELGLDLPRVATTTHHFLMNPKIGEAVLLGAHDRQGELKELWSVAQHYGLRTKLLDWSRSSGVGMTFAAQGALRMIERCLEESTCCRRENLDFEQDQRHYLENKRLSVWIINRDGVEQMNSLLNGSYRKSDYTESEFSCYVDFVEPPTQSNKNIVSQLGAFTILNLAIKNTKYRHLEERIVSLNEFPPV